MVSNLCAWYSGTSRSSLIRQLESLSDPFDGDHTLEDHRNVSDVLSKLRDVQQKKLDVLFKDVVCLQESTWPALSLECERSFSVLLCQ